MLLLVVSDFHLGKGQYFDNGQINLLESFDEDERFIEFIKFYSSGDYQHKDVHLVLNGDILNLIQVDVDGVQTSVIDQEITCHAIDAIALGHKAFFYALKEFHNCPNKKITYIIGNHDAGIAFDEAQTKLKTLIGENLTFAFELNLGVVHIEHGHRFEVINTPPRGKYFIEGPSKRKILNLPWGSLFCINLLPVLKKDRPMIDKIRPMSSYFKWSLIHDTRFFFRMSHLILRYLIETSFKTYTDLNSNFKTTLKLLKQITIYPHFAAKAKSIFKRDAELRVVIMGHTHLSEWRKFPQKKYYFNTGTWNPIPSIDAALVEDYSKLTYVAVELSSDAKKVQRASMTVWRGEWRPYREESVVSPLDF